MSKQIKSQVILSSSEDDEPLAVQARKSKTQTATPAQVTALNILSQPTPAPNPNPKVTPNPDLAPTRAMTLPSAASQPAQARRSATGPSIVTPGILSPTVGDSNTTQNNSPLSSFLRPHGDSIVRGRGRWWPVDQAVSRKQYVGTSSKQQGPSLGARARLLGEAPSVGPGRQTGRPSNAKIATRASEPSPASPRSRIATSASQPSKSTEDNEEDDLFGDNELGESKQPADNVDVEMDLNIDMSEPTVVELPAHSLPKSLGPAPATASKAVQLEVEATSFLSDVIAEVAT